MDANYLYINAGHRLIPADILLADRFFTSLNKEVIIINIIIIKYLTRIDQCKRIQN